MNLFKKPTMIEIGLFTGLLLLTLGQVNSNKNLYKAPHDDISRERLFEMSDDNMTFTIDCHVHAPLSIYDENGAGWWRSYEIPANKSGLSFTLPLYKLGKVDCRDLLHERSLEDGLLPDRTSMALHDNSGSIIGDDSLEEFICHLKKNRTFSYFKDNGEEETFTVGKYRPVKFIVKRLLTSNYTCKELLEEGIDYNPERSHLVESQYESEIN